MFCFLEEKIEHQDSEDPWESSSVSENNEDVELQRY